MTLLHEAVDQKKLDTRMVERNVARGVITQQELQQKISALPDDGENAEYVSIDSLLGDIDADENGAENGSSAH